MGIKDRQTYGEYYWAMQVEAQAAFADDSEKILTPFISGLLDDIEIIDEMPAGIKSFIQGIKSPDSFAFLPFMAGVGLNAIDEALDIAFSGPMAIIKRSYNKLNKQTWPTSAQANTLYSRRKVPEEFWDTIIATEGYEPVFGSLIYESQLPYPTIPEAIRYSRYHGEPDNPWDEFEKWYHISPRDWPVWKWLSQQQLSTLDVQSAYRKGIINEADVDYLLSAIGWESTNSYIIKELSWTTPNAMLLVQGDLQQQREPERILADISRADINPEFAQQYLDAILIKPNTQDIIAYTLRKDPELSSLPMRLRQIGIHPEHFDVYKTLAFPIPPVADIITMAVREAFTPAIAERFGQYEGFPQELEDFGLQKGLTPEWSRRYWAAHWNLPSAGQGFEMLHRGAITVEELDLLLRALDVMPFWRDKLTKIAYRRLSRVDIRRMYQQGVLNEGEVLEAYNELGYNERDAERMTAFVIKQVLTTQSKFTARDVIGAYAKYMITRPETISLLKEVGVRDENIDFIITSAEYKREWELTDNRIAAIRNLYKKQVYDDNVARSELLKLDLPAERVDVLMAQWYIDEKDKPPRTWTTAQTLGFIKEGLITKDRGMQELRNIGYDVEHINIYMKAGE